MQLHVFFTLAAVEVFCKTKSSLIKKTFGKPKGGHKYLKKILQAHDCIILSEKTLLCHHLVFLDQEIAYGLKIKSFLIWIKKKIQTPPSLSLFGIYPISICCKTWTFHGERRTQGGLVLNTQPRKARPCPRSSLPFMSSCLMLFLTSKKPA